jgi:hypothetical protein
LLGVALFEKRKEQMPGSFQGPGDGGMA